MNCPSCNVSIQPNEEFCGNCGRPVKVTVGQDPTAVAHGPGGWTAEPSKPSPVTPFPPPPIAHPYPTPPNYYVRSANTMPPVSQSASTSGKALAALIVGVAGIFTGLDLLVVPGIVAIVLGYMARREIRQRAGMLGGNGMALAGIITGAIGAGFGILYWAFIIIAIIVGIFSAGSR